MYRNKDKQNTIPLEKKLTKEPTKYDKQYTNLDYDTLIDIVDTKKYLIITQENTTSNNSTIMLPHKKNINNKKK